ncbi:MAG TPA: hypothetical protein VHG91_21860 [Longimicrobium sp.]|nr:hypothetical protein [Longimicrobium sp.]
MKTILRFPLLLLALLLAARPAAAQATPEALAERYFATMRAGDWKANAALMHPEALQSFQSLLLPILEIDEEGEVARMLGVADNEAVKALAPAAFYERFLNGMMGQQAGLAAILGGSRAEIVGHVMEGDTAHIVYRLNMEVDGAPMSKVTVISAKRDGGVWRALLTGEMEGLAGMFRT